MGRFGYYVIDADGHGGEPLGWRKRIPKAFEPAMRRYVAAMKSHYTGLPGGGAQINEHNPRDAKRPEDELDFDVAQRPGMFAAKRLEDMELEGIDLACSIRRAPARSPQTCPGTTRTSARSSSRRR